MKKTILLILALMLTSGMSAQKQYRIWKAGESTKVTIADNPSIQFSENGNVLTIGDSIYNAADIDSITIIHRVLVQFNGNTASVTVPKAVAGDITCVTDGAHVTLTNTNTSHEIDFVLAGTSTDGSFTYNGAYKATFRLNGLSLTSARGAAIDIQCGKRSHLILEEGTENSLVDYAEGTQKACLYCKGHLEVSGEGTLNVTGNASHGISTKEYLQVKKSTGVINILAAAGDAINVNQYYMQNGGILNIDANTMGDGIQVDSTALDTLIIDNQEVIVSDTLNGQVIISGGTLNIEITHEGRRAIKSADNITINGGTVNVNNSGDGSRGIQAGIDIIINEEDAETEPTVITVNATGGVYKYTSEQGKEEEDHCAGIRCKRDLTVNAGTTTVTMSSGVYGIRVKRNLTINGGSTSCKTTTGGRGQIRVAGTVKRNGGTIYGTLVKA